MNSFFLFLLLTGGPYREHLREPAEWFLHDGFLVASDRVQAPGDSEGYQCYTYSNYVKQNEDMQAAQDCADGVPDHLARWHPFHPYDRYTIHRGQLTQDQKVKAPNDREFEGGMCRAPEIDDQWYRWLRQNENWCGHRFVQYVTGASS